MTRSHEQGPSQPEHRDTDDIRPEEQKEYLAVPGWRIWKQTVHGRPSPEWNAALAEVETKLLTLAVRVDGRGHSYVDTRYEEITGRTLPGIFKANSFDRPLYIIEPLTEEEVDAIDTQGEAPGPLGTTDKPHKLLRPADLQAIFEEPVQDPLDARRLLQPPVWTDELLKGIQDLLKEQTKEQP